MSADRWTICPKCKIERVAKCEQLQREIVAAYGEVPLGEYLKLREKEVPPLEESLREDYEAYMKDTGVFVVRYSCSCSLCHFEFTYKKEINSIKEPTP